MKRKPYFYSINKQDNSLLEFKGSNFDAKLDRIETGQCPLSMTLSCHILEPKKEFDHNCFDRSYI